MPVCVWVFAGPVFGIDRLAELYMRAHKLSGIFVNLFLGRVDLRGIFARPEICAIFF